MEITQAAAAEIDTELARLWVQEQTEVNYLAGLLEYVRKNEGRTFQGNIDSALERIAAHQVKLAEIRADAEPFEAEFVRRGGWNRYFLVNNTGGHVHRERECQTCFVTTQFVWLPSLSDCDETAMVAEYGEMACTVCFPAAPTMRGYNDGTSALARYSQAERDERAAAKAAKAAIKAEKALVQPVRLVGRYGNTLTTVTAARNELSTLVQNRIYYQGDNETDAERAAQIAQIEEALAQKGWSQEQIQAVKDRAEKKARKETA